MEANAYLGPFGTLSDAKSRLDVAVPERRLFGFETETGARKFYVMTHDQAFRFVVSQNKRVHEYFVHGPFKLFFDLEHEESQKTERVLGALLAFLGTKYPDCTIQVLDGSRATKSSFHVICAAAVASVADVARIARSFVDLLGAADALVVDLQVYRRDGCLRCPLSRSFKNTGELAPEMRFRGDVSEKSLERFLEASVTHVATQRLQGDLLHLDTPKTPAPKRARSHQIPPEIQRIKDFLEEKLGIVTFEATSESPLEWSVAVRYVVCPVAGRPHRSNRSYLRLKLPPPLSEGFVSVTRRVSASFFCCDHETAWECPHDLSLFLDG